MSTEIIIELCDADYQNERDSRYLYSIDQNGKLEELV